MSYEPKFMLPGSERRPVSGAEMTGPVGEDEIVQVTIVLKRRGLGPELATTEHHTREEYGILHGADPRVLDTVERFAHQHGLTILERNAATRSVKTSGGAITSEQVWNELAS